MIIVIVILFIFIICLIVMKFSLEKKLESRNEYLKNLRKKIQELDENNVEVNSSTRMAKIIVPDIVDSNESTTTSTQKDECKEYIVGPKERIEKTVIGTERKDEIFEKSEFSTDDDNPIKEEKDFLSKIFNKKEEE